MGNIYNVEQKLETPRVAGTSEGSSSGLSEWNKAIRKQIMEKLKGYAPEHVDKVIKATFGDLGDMQGF